MSSEPTSQSRRAIAELHRDLVQAFEGFSEPLDMVQYLELEWGNRGTEAAVQDLENIFNSIRHLELTVPVVAPMKAGKSTLINAIVGYQLLPARANPMTTLPTKIILVDDMPLDRPELELPDDLRNLFSQLEHSVGDFYRNGWRVPSEHSYLDELAAQIATNSLPALEPLSVGKSKVTSTLIRLNDQLRLGALANTDDYLSEIFELPILRTGYLHDYEAGEEGGGELVIIDTPGPNESALAARLGPALETQLRRAHVVLVILDYMQMGSEASADIRNLLANHLEIIGTSKLYAVVNKVDARKGPADLQEDETRLAVQHSLGFSDAEAKSRVFEVVASWGLTGSNALAEIKQAGAEYDPKESSAAFGLFRELNPIESDEEIRELLVESTTKEIERKASRILDRSRVIGLVKQAIDQLRMAAAPSVMDSGLDRIQAALADLDEVVEVATAMAASNEDKVTHQLEQLRREIAALQEHREAAPGVAALRNRFKIELDSFMLDVKVDGAELIQSIWSTTEEPTEPQPSPVKQEKRRSSVGGFIRGAKNKLSEIWPGADSSETHAVTTRSKAEEITEKMIAVVVDQLRALLEQKNHELEERLRGFGRTVVQEQETRVGALVERASSELAQAFDVTLTVPTPSVGDSEIDVSVPKAKKKTDTKTVSKTVIEKKKVWYKLWLGTKDVEVTKYEKVSTDRYIISRSDVAHQLTGSLESQLTIMRKALDDYVANQLSDQLNRYYEALAGYLHRYEVALSASLRSFEGGQVAHAHRREKLSDLKDSLSETTVSIVGFQQRLDEAWDGLGNNAD